MGQDIIKQEFNKQEVELIRTQILPNSQGNELEFFLYQCRERGLNPLLKQVWGVIKQDSYGNRKLSVSPTIDGLRLIAMRTGKYKGQTKPEWCGDDGVWKDVWVANTPPIAARVGIYHADFIEPLYMVATWKGYAQYSQKGLNPTWEKLSSEMLLKCAESCALRKAFPEDMSGLYLVEELGVESAHQNILLKVEDVTPISVDLTTEAYNKLFEEAALSVENATAISDVEQVNKAAHPAIQSDKKFKDLCNEKYIKLKYGK